MTQQLASAPASRSKVIAVGGLAVVFVVVLYVRLGESSDVETPLSTAALSTTTSPPTSGHIAAPKSDERSIAANSRSLPVVDVRRILASNPFHARTSAASDDSSDDANSESTEGPQSFVKFLGSFFGETPSRSGKASPKSSGTETASSGNRGADDDVPADEEVPKVIVSAIVTGGRRPSAMIGDTLYSENDRLGDKWRIVSIRSNGIIVRPDE